MQQGVCILGSTGSIGCSTLDVISRHLDKYRVKVLTANSNWQKLLEQTIAHQPEKVIISDPSAAKAFEQAALKNDLSVIVESGVDSLINAAKFPGVSIVVAAIVGAAGLLPTLSAAEQGHKILLANKEALVMSGELFTKAVARNQATLLPVDSEHNAIFQALPHSRANHGPSLEGVSKILLTGSGGPFRELPLEQLSAVTPAQACAHPNWDMGKKISVDSATMMNKGLELIEACFLFNVDLSMIDIVVHPQSIVHSMVAYHDGSVLAQMGRPDMRTPIAHTLAWPERIDSGVSPLDFYQMSQLTFEAPDYQRFPCLRLAAEAMKSGGTAPCVLNAANEVAVEHFLNSTIAFTDIPRIIEATLAKSDFATADSIDCILQADKQSRILATQLARARS